MSDLKFIVTAVPARANFLDYLHRHIPDLIVVWDQGQGAMETFRRSWRLLPECPTVRLQDDVVLTVDFVAKCRMAISEHPNVPINFFSRSKYDSSRGSRWKPGGSWMMNQCYYLPPNSTRRVLSINRSRFPA
jgi:hypothetical protein